MFFGYLYNKGIIKNNDRWFKLWCWLAFQRWYHILNIPYHIIAGIYYGYSAKEIFNFCLCCITGKLYTYRPVNPATYSNACASDLDCEELIEGIKRFEDSQKEDKIFRN